jgi:hypothetical protein
MATLFASLTIIHSINKMTSSSFTTSTLIRIFFATYKKALEKRPEADQRVISFGNCFNKITTATTK